MKIKLKLIKEWEFWVSLIPLFLMYLVTYFVLKYLVFIDMPVDLLATLVSAMLVIYIMESSIGRKVSDKLSFDVYYYLRKGKL